MEYDNTNTIVIFKNNKRTNEKAPEYTGKVNVNGEDFEVSLWIRESKSGDKFFSGKIREPYNKQQQAPKPKQRSFDVDTSDVPF